MAWGRRDPDWGEDACARTMREVDRRWFLPPSVRDEADRDEPLPIGSGATNSQPSTVIAMLRLLDVQAGMSCLDVGAGSGWTTALLKDLVGARGTVLGVELEPTLVRVGNENLVAAGVAARIVGAKGGLGWPAGAPYDRILVSAMAALLPDELVGQLAPDGVLVIPVDGWMLRVVRARDGVGITRHGRYRFVALRPVPAD